MKKLIIFASLFSVAMFSAQNLSATINYKDGKVANVLADELNKVNKKNEIAVKASSTSAREFVPLDKLSKITYNVDGKTAIAEPVAIAEIKNEKKWMYRIYSGKLNAYTFTDVDLQSTFRNGNFFSQEVNLNSFVFQYKDEPGHIVSVVMGGPTTINTFQKKANLKMISNYFKDKCPQLLTALDKGEITFKKNPMVFADYFEKNCN